MKSIIKLFLFFLITNCSYLSYSQISQDMIKYWYYRNRLNNFFVVPGEKHGESQVKCVRNKIWADNENNPAVTQQSKNVDYGQHGKYQGLYIGFLATECYLYNKNGQYADASRTLQELVWAINAVKKYWDEQAEPYWTDVSGITPNFNGFFIRGNVPCDFFKRQNENLIS